MNTVTVLFWVLIASLTVSSVVLALLMVSALFERLRRRRCECGILTLPQGGSHLMGATVHAQSRCSPIEETL